MRRQWEIYAPEQRKEYVFPEPDLLEDLIELYFARMNIFLPLLHRPTLEEGLSKGLHLKDEGFGSVVLLMCAVGSRYSDDPRVFLENTQSEASAGWKWFDQVQMIRKSLMSPPRLYDLQMYCVSNIPLYACIQLANRYINNSCLCCSCRGRRRLRHAGP